LIRIFSVEIRIKIEKMEEKPVEVTENMSVDIVAEEDTLPHIMIGI